MVGGENHGQRTITSSPGGKELKILTPAEKSRLEVFMSASLAFLI